MAIKPTIYKFRISLSDLNRNYYDTLNLTLAQHPSETLERMMARVLAYCINAQEDLVFTKGLSDIDEPDIWVRTLDEQTALWIEVGEPAFDRLKKATRLANKVNVYSFNSKSDVWWKQLENKAQQLNVSVFKFEWEAINQLTTFVQRTMDFSISITGDSAYIATETGESEVSWTLLQGAAYE